MKRLVNVLLALVFAATANAVDDRAAAIEAYQSALHSEPSAASAAFYYRRIGICQGRQGAFEAALATYRAGVDAAITAADRELEAENRHGVGITLKRMGQFEEALAETKREVEIVEHCGHPEHLIRGLGTEAQIEASLGQPRVAEQLLQRCLTIARKANLKIETASTLQSLGYVYAGAGDLETGIRYTRDAMALTDPSDREALGGQHANIAQMRSAILPLTV